MSSGRCQQMQKQGMLLTLAIYLFSYFGVMTLLTTFPKLHFGAETFSVLSSVTKFHGLWVYKEFGAHSAWLLCKAMTWRNLKFYMPLWKEMKLLTCLVGMWGALMRWALWKEDCYININQGWDNSLVVKQWHYNCV